MLPNGIHAQTRDDVHAGVGRSPDERAKRVLGGSVPGARDQDEGGRDGALQGTLERAEDHEMGEVLGKRNAQNNDTPEYHDDGQEAARVALLHEPVAGELAGHVGQIEDGHEPVELLAHEARVFADAEDGLNAQGGLVGLLGAVAEPHEGEEPQVDLPAEPSEIGIRVRVGVEGISERLFGDAVEDVCLLGDALPIIGVRRGRRLRLLGVDVRHVFGAVVKYRMKRTEGGIGELGRMSFQYPRRLRVEEESPSYRVEVEAVATGPWTR